MSKEEKIPEHITRRLQEVEQRQKIYTETVKALQTEERFQNYFKNYHPDSVKDFIEQYATRKADWYLNAPTYRTLRKHKEGRFYHTAWNILAFIQSRKLLELQARWIANEIKLEGVEICYDLELIDRDPLTNPRVSPVSAGDIDFFIAYMEQLPTEERWIDFGHISYRTFIVLHLEHYSYDGYPAYCKFCDEHGPVDLRLIKNVRETKERFYKLLKSDEEKAAEEKRLAEAEAKREKRPFMPYIYEREFTEEIVKRFDSKEVLELYQAFTAGSEIHKFHESIDSNLYMLNDAQEYVPVSDNDDWREAIKLAANLYVRKKTLELLPGVFEQYLAYRQQGIDIYQAEGIARNTGYYSAEHRTKCMEHILRGRVRNGEPADLNF